MILAACLILGAVTGWTTASRRGGNRFDKWQFAIAFAILFAVLGLFGLVLADRLG
jgi:hypothetical protein